MMKALEKPGNRVLPYILLAVRSGKKVYSCQAPVEILQLKIAVIGHEWIGRYF